MPGPPPPPPAQFSPNPSVPAEDQTQSGVLTETKSYDAYETDPAPAASYGGYGVDMSVPDANAGSAFSFLSTGNLLEDLDNMLRIYRVTYDEIERTKLFKEFWSKWNELTTKEPKELLKIPTKVRGFLSVLPHITPYQADQILREVLSDGGLLSEPEYIERRYIFKMFVVYEFGNIFSWILSTIGTLKTLMFLTSLLLSLSIFVHIFVDFYFGNVWRALLMEFLTPLAFISTCQYINTPFFGSVIRVIIEDNCSALATVPGRAFLSILVSFFCLGEFDIRYIFLLGAATLNLCVTGLIVFTYKRLNNVSAHVRILTGSGSKLEAKFVQYDVDRDGLLNASELQAFFNSFRQEMSKWSLEMMIMQYDIQRDGGLRYEALDIWFRNEPINGDTRAQALAAKPREFYGIAEKSREFNAKEMEWAGVSGAVDLQNRAQANSLALQMMGATKK